MKRLGKFFKQSPDNQWFLLKTTTLLLLVKAGLLFMPFQNLYHFLHRLSHPGKAENPGNLRRILEAVELSSRNMPFAATCLVRALTGQVLLLRSGYNSELRIGVARGSEGKMEAHAWIVYQGKVIIGNRDDLSRYMPFPSLNPKESTQ
ncbi:MAG: lasso peptide biosynthesis B2 protein [Anaerolineaceae bacterium]|nr:lasso peptide biosynthesis B2 protein [Anaerolineaceae bacterium]